MTWWAVLMLLCLGSGAALAQTDEIQVYDAEIVAPGAFNLTWHNNYTPSGRTRPDFRGGIVPNHALNAVPEFAYGVAPWWELGAYTPIYTLSSDGRLTFDGLKLRTLFVSPHAHDRMFFYGVNFEFSYNRPQWDTSRYSGEIRPIVGAHLGAFDFIFNPILDTGFDGLRQLDFAPAMRVAFHANETLALALEHYADFGPLHHLVSGPNQSRSLFAVADVGGAGIGLEMGIGKGLTRGSDSVVLKFMLMHDF